MNAKKPAGEAGLGGRSSVAAGARALACAAAAALACVAGCGGGETKELGAYLGNLEFNAPLESAAYVSLGRFDVPAPVRLKPTAGETRTVWIRLSFDLYAETDPKDAASLAAAAKRHQGALNDALLTIIRTSSTDELTDPRLGALKLRMSEAARPLLGERKLRQLLFDDIDTPML